MKHRYPIALVLAATTILSVSACTVVVEENGEGEFSQIDFVLENQGAEPIFVQTGVYPSPSWLRLTMDGETVRIRYDCSTPCPCDPNLACSLCDPAPPAVREVAPGGEIVEPWSGVRYVFLERDGRQCHETVQMEGGEMEAEICFGYAVSHTTDGSFVEDDVHCRTFVLEYGVDEEVRLVVE